MIKKIRLHTLYINGVLLGGNTMDKNEMRKVIINRIELEAERANLQEQIAPLEKNVRKMTALYEDAEENKRRIEESKIGMLLLGVFGKKEERLQQEDNVVRKARGEVNAAQFELDSVNSRLQSIAIELNSTEDILEEFLATLEGEEGNAIKWRIIALKELSNMRYAIREDIAEMKTVLKKAEEIWVYGDIKADLSGRRYNSKDSTLRAHTALIKRAVSELVEHITRYNAYAPEEIKIIFHEDWMDNKAYWDGQQLAEDSHARIQKVDDWFFRFESLWNKMKKRQNEAEEILRSEVLEYLRY